MLKAIPIIATMATTDPTIVSSALANRALPEVRREEPTPITAPDAISRAWAASFRQVVSNQRPIREFPRQLVSGNGQLLMTNPSHVTTATAQGTNRPPRES
jgi:hypothetical protein